MRSRPGDLRTIRPLWLLLAGLLIVAPGCQLNRSFFQMDSNSRVPFFGVDLAPKWPKRGSSVDGVSRLQSEARTAKPQPSAHPNDAPAEERSLTLSATDSSASTVESAPVELFR